MNKGDAAWVLAVVVVFLATATLAQDAGAPAKSAEGVEDRLLEAELLEVASGDVDKAMVIYQAIVDQQNVRDSTRARAFLYMARCHRKLGQLEKARTLLERVVTEHKKEREVEAKAVALTKRLADLS